jgi:hypothetical protein
MQASALLHEVSHLARTVNAADYCYGEGECDNLAKNLPDLAVRSGDAYRLFAECVAGVSRDRCNPRQQSI